MAGRMKCIALSQSMGCCDHWLHRQKEILMEVAGLASCQATSLTRIPSADLPYRDCSGVIATPVGRTTGGVTPSENIRPRGAPSAMLEAEPQSHRSSRQYNQRSPRRNIWRPASAAEALNWSSSRFSARNFGRSANW